MLSVLLSAVIFQTEITGPEAYGESFGIQSDYCAGLAPGALPSAEQLEACWNDVSEQFVAAGADIDSTIMSNQTRQCILRTAPHVERAFTSLHDGATYLIEFLCADQLRDDYVQRTAELFAAESEQSVEVGEGGVVLSARPLSGYPSNRVGALADYERPAVVLDFIGRTLLELRINRIEMERQEEN